MEIAPPTQTQTMAFSFSMIAFKGTTEADVREVLNDLDLGMIDEIHTRERDDERTQFYVHYSSATANGKTLVAQLADVEARQKAGEVDVWPKRIVYGYNPKTQRDVYWQIYKTATKAEYAASKKAPELAGKMKPRLV